jgi:pimeloyl-ACP methyl ester carboxylesterase
MLTAMRLHIVREGESGTPIVFVHGLGTSGESWQALMEHLRGNHRVIALDLLGHGNSPVPDDVEEYTRDRALDDIDDVLATLDERAVLVGHSLGGYLALAHAATRPNVAKGIVVLNTGPGFRDAEKREAWNVRSRRNAHRFPIPEVATNLNLQHDSVVMEHLGDMHVPTLILVGGADRPEYFSGGQYMERKMHNAHMVVVDGGGHSMHEDSHAAEVADLIHKFVADLH